MSRFVPDRSYAAPHLGRRILIIEKTASQIQSLPIFYDSAKDEVDSRGKLGILPIMLFAAGLYAKMAEKSPALAVGAIPKIVAKHPGLAAAMAAAAPFVFNSVMGEGAKGNYVEGLEPEIDMMGKKIDEARQKPFAKLGSVSAGMSRIFLGVPATYISAGMLQKSKDLDPIKEENNIKKFIRQNPDIIGAALAVDGLYSMTGRGTHGAIQAFKKMTKVAELSDFAMDSMVWPLAFGGKGLAARISGGLMDQVIVESSKKFLSKKRKEDKIN
jgi:hypothetical protein